MFDLHVHAAPDVIDRLADDATIARQYAAAGLTGCVFKGHHADTTGRADAVRRAGILTAYGGVTCNNTVGGFNPNAVAAALAMGARVVWMPTEDAAVHSQAGLTRWTDTDERLRTAVLATPPADPSTEAAVRAILGLIADADAVLATGHLSGAEIDWLLDAAHRAGVRRVLLTHPTYTVPALTHRQTVAFADRGALVEITAYQLLHQPGCDAGRLADLVRAVGAGRVVLSSDAGQVDSPPPPEALHRLVHALAGQGLSHSDLAAMSGEVPEGLVSR